MLLIALLGPTLGPPSGIHQLFHKLYPGRLHQLISLVVCVAEFLRFCCYKLQLGMPCQSGKNRASDIYIYYLSNFLKCIYGYILYLRYRHINRRKSQDSPYQLVSWISEPSKVSTGSDSGMNICSILLRLNEPLFDGHPSSFFLNFCLCKKLLANLNLIF